MTVQNVAFFGLTPQQTVVPFMRTQFGSSPLVPAPQISLERLNLGVRGQVQTLLYSGTVGDTLSSLDACVAVSGQDNLTGSFSFLLTGTIL